MKVLTVNSSSVNNIEFADTEQQIRIEFNRGAQYAYDVPEYESTKDSLISEAEEVERGNASASVGKLVNSFIRNGALANAMKL
jgi:hypothetical protein